MATETKIKRFDISPNSFTYFYDMDYVGKGVGASKTTTAVFGNTIVEQFSIGDEIYLAGHIPSGYTGGDVTVHLVFLPMGSETDKEVRWQIDYLIHTEGETTNGTTGTLQSSDIVLSSTQYEAQGYDFTIPSADIGTKDHIYIKVSRINIIDGTDPATKPAVVNVALKIPIYQIAY